MCQKTAMECLFFSGCAFFILMMLCTISHAGGAGRVGFDNLPSLPRVDNETGNTKAQPRTVEPTGERTRVSAGKDQDLKIVFKEDDWIDRPGNKLKLGGYILGGIALASIVTGGVFFGMAKEAGDACSRKYDFCFLPGLGEATSGLIALTVGLGTGVVSLGLILGGAAEARAYEQERIRPKISPYLNPLIEINPKTAGASLDGAVVGVKGRF